MENDYEGEGGCESAWEAYKAYVDDHEFQVAGGYRDGLPVTFADFKLGGASG